MNFIIKNAIHFTDKEIHFIHDIFRYTNKTNLYSHPAKILKKILYSPNSRNFFQCNNKNRKKPKEKTV